MESNSNNKNSDTNSIENLAHQFQNNLNLEKFNLGEIYNRPRLIKIPRPEEKGFLAIDTLEDIVNDLISTYNLRIYNYIPPSRLEFYYYNCESIKDYGWGCAWRCLQTTLGTIRNYILSEEKFEEFLPYFESLINYDITFEKLFLEYGNKELLIKLFLSAYNLIEIPEYILQKEFAPHLTENGWAEPFLIKLILHDFNLQGDLFLVNGYCKWAYAPEEVFSRTVSYNEFKEYLLIHFSREIKLPVIIDDTLLTMCIIGADKNEDGTLTLLVADPHVGQEKEGKTGIYQVHLDQYGNFDKELNSHPNLNGNKFNFEKGSFMVFAPRLD